MKAVEWYAVAPPCSHEEFLAAVRVYARDIVTHHDLSVDVSSLEWAVSTRAKRRAGLLRYRDDTPVEIRLAWRLFENQGWQAVASTVRHELAHAHLVTEHGDASHGPRFQQLADRLNTTTHCQRFTPPEWWVVCTDCEHRLPRYRESRLVQHPGEYACGRCGGTLTVHTPD